MSGMRPDSADAIGAPGTLAWWAARLAPREEPRRGRPRRSFERIIDVALEVVDEVGAGAVNMRMLAERLETSTATLYRHVSGKEELMVYVVDRVLGEILDDGRSHDGPRNWDEVARWVAFRFHATLSRHPNVLPLLVSQLPIGPSALAVQEQSIAAFMSSGFSPGLAARSYNTIAVYVIGFFAVREAEQAREHAAALRDYYRSLDPDTYPYTVAAAGALTEIAPEGQFAEGLQFILDGIDRARRRRQPPRSGT
jgi:AcrR family transcriptional regulator